MFIAISQPLVVLVLMPCCVHKIAGTTRAAQVSVGNGLVCKLCITNWAHEPFLSPSVAAPMLRCKKVVCGARRW